jgi:hypothetical protein
VRWVKATAITPRGRRAPIGADPARHRLLPRQPAAAGGSPHAAERQNAAAVQQAGRRGRALDVVQGAVELPVAAAVEAVPYEGVRSRMGSRDVPRHHTGGAGGDRTHDRRIMRIFHGND